MSQSVKLKKNENEIENTEKTEKAKILGRRKDNIVMFFLAFLFDFIMIPPKLFYPFF
ncbi:MAG: hypothetical protein ACOX1K_02705 [Defluviitoga tunisiensis]|jgi:hypothetical protein